MSLPSGGSDIVTPVWMVLNVCVLSNVVDIMQVQGNRDQRLWRGVNRERKCSHEWRHEGGRNTVQPLDGALVHALTTIVQTETRLKCDPLRLAAIIADALNPILLQGV